MYSGGTVMHMVILYLFPNTAMVHKFWLASDVVVSAMPKSQNGNRSWNENLPVT